MWLIVVPPQPPAIKIARGAAIATRIRATDLRPTMPAPSVTIPLGHATTLSGSLAGGILKGPDTLPRPGRRLPSKSRLPSASADAPRANGPRERARAPGHGRARSLGGRLVEGDGQRARVGQLDEIARLYSLEILRVARLHGLGVPLGPLDRHRVLGLVDGDDSPGESDLMGDGPCRRVARLRGLGGLLGGHARSRRAGLLDLDGEGLVVLAHHGVTHLDRVQLLGVPDLERQGPVRTLQGHRLLLLVDGLHDAAQ